MPEAILIIAPQDLERRRLRKTLTEAGYVVWDAPNAVEGLLNTLEKRPNLIVLAEEIPPLTALDVMRVLRQITTIPVMILGNGGESEEVNALEVGADFYQRRPVHNAALIARVRSLIRRRRGAGSETLQHPAQMRMAA
jgi:two-component system KDP operon response regulator KdpE